MVNEFISGRYAAGRQKKDWKSGAKKLAIFLVAAAFVLFNVLELKPSYQNTPISQHRDDFLVDGDDGNNTRTPAIGEKTNLSLADGDLELERSPYSPPPVVLPDGGGFEPKRSPYSEIIQLSPPPPVVVSGDEMDDVSSCFTCSSCPVVGPRKRKRNRTVEILSISDMDDRLVRSRTAGNAVSNSTIPPRWPSPVDQDLRNAKAKIAKAPIITDDPELYGPVFRNLSAFKRSYELMEKILKVYVYKEGDGDIFRNPVITGIYASEGWFMNQMLHSRKYLVGDPSKAHLFYVPFGSVNARFKLYIPNSHSRKNIIAYLDDYVKLISSQNPFWNRTCGADHFVAGCHDWAAAETDYSLKPAMRALCTADIKLGFDIGKDVSLPATRIISKRKPQLNIGGKPAKKRTTLAFFAGQMHGYLRPILIKHWENKDPDMVITGPIPHRLGKKSTANSAAYQKNPYLYYMKNSKYCLCPRGSQVWSTRIMESIYFGCVPVIISDNFVPPLFEVLNWPEFAVMVPEKNVPELKQVLTEIPTQRYMELERGVREVRKHFLWNRKPVKYDLFHMILHSLWSNRLNQINLD